MAKILYIDDVFSEKGVAYGYRLMAESIGHSLLTASDGKQGLEIIAQEPVDLIFLDLNMPGMDGAEVLRELKIRNSQIPVVMCTSENPERAINWAGYEHVIGDCSLLDKTQITKYLSMIEKKE